MVDVMEKANNKVYKSKIRQDYDVKDGYFYYIELPNELIKELGWYEDLKVDVTVKLGDNGNVIVVARA
jgi:hypothetical protein